MSTTSSMNALSQKTADRAKTRGKTQAASGVAAVMEAGGEVVSRHGLDREVWESALAAIMTRLEQLEKLDQLEEIRGKLDAITVLDAKIETLSASTNRFVQQTRDDLDTLAGLIGDASRQQDATDRSNAILEYKLATVEQENRQLHMTVNDMANKSKECNLRVDGKVETENENLIGYMLEMGKKNTQHGIDPAAIVSAFRVGKKRATNANAQGTASKPRTILVVFRSVRERNELYFARTKLRSTDAYKNIYLNDDVTATTRRVREDYRAVAALVRNENKEVRIHDDGILIEGKKYRYNQVDQLPQRYTVRKAKTVRIDNGLYFQSEHSVLSNFHQAPIIHEGIFYPTSEHKYQADKCQNAGDQARRQLVIKAKTPLEAKRLGSQVKEATNWAEVREEIMKRAVDLKFDQNPDLAEFLVNTRDYTLHEATTDTYFGTGAMLNSREMRNRQFIGHNILGKILEAKRESLKVECEDVDSD